MHVDAVLRLEDGSLLQGLEMKFLKQLLLLPVVLLLLFEEWGWVPLQRVMGWIARHPFLAYLEIKISALSPCGAMLVFLIPGICLFPIKLLALFLIGHGHLLLGGGLILLAKILGTAFTARLFKLTKPALMSLSWFARGYTTFTGWKERAFATVRATWGWRVGRVLKRAMSRSARYAWKAVTSRFA
jgi:hypothetical protein